MSPKPEILKASTDNIQRAAAALRQGKLVGMPTETVYGLAASVYQEEALRAVFAYKKRPFEDPLIVHVLDLQAALELWQLSPRALQTIKVLSQSFWPGPLTIVAKARPTISKLATAGGDSLGIRCPTHPLARALIQISEQPIAAPSANLFGHVSPTCAAHVADDFADRELLILDGDDSSIGIESTVVKVCDAGDLQLLRHGAITEQQICELMIQTGSQVVLSSKNPGQLSQKIESPGQYLRHYAPHTPAWILCLDKKSPVGAESLQLSACACLDFAGRLFAIREQFQSYLDLSPDGDAVAVAQILFQQLRALEAGTESRVLLLPQFNPKLPEQQAIYDRIYRACEGKLAYLDEDKILLS